MSNRPLDNIVWHLRELVAVDQTAAATDRELLRRFVQQQDEAAFTALVQRHGPMVLSVCRRVLRHVHDAEDACQAAFLVLARKAGSIRRSESLGSWLHGVAFRAAANLKRQVARRHAHETAAVDVAQQADPGDVSWREVRAVLDEELRHLPAHYQAPLVLCYLEGKTRDEAAQELGWSTGTLRGRLERGRDLLRTRLARRGLMLSASLLATQLTGDVSAALPATQWVEMARAAVSVAAPGAVPAAGVVSARVTTVMREVMQAMWVAKLKTAAVIVAAVSLLGIGAGLFAGGALTAQSASAEGPAPGQGASPAAGGSDDKVTSPRPAPGAAQPDNPQELARQKAQSRLNLKSLALAMHNYNNTYGHFPAPAIYADDRQQQGGGMPSGGMPGAPPGNIGRGGPSLPGSGIAAPPPVGFPAGPGGASGGPPGSIFSPFGQAPGGRGGPPATKQGKALLSWRVAILPFLGEDQLYKQFKLNEPWDSPHNKKLLSKIPKIFADPTGRAHDSFATYYQVFVGPHAAFEKHQFLGIASFIDGTSNTILIVEAANPVPWTKPEDLPFAPDEPIPELGGLFPGIFHAAFADGSVHAISKKIDPTTLRYAIMRDDGYPNNLEPYTVPASRRTAALKEQNDRLRQELRQEQERLQRLQKEKSFLQELEDNAEIQRLEKERQDLNARLRKARDEADRLKEEIERLKGSSDKRPDERRK